MLTAPAYDCDCDWATTTATAIGRLGLRLRDWAAVRRGGNRHPLDGLLPTGAPAQPDVGDGAEEHRHAGPLIQPQAQDAVRRIDSQRLDPGPARCVRRQVERERPAGAQPEPTVGPDHQPGAPAGGDAGDWALPPDVPLRVAVGRRVV